MRGNTSTHVGLLYTIPFVGLLGSSVLIPVLPRIAAVLDLPFSQVTWLITTLSVSSALAVPVIGFLSDTFTRTVVLVPGLILYGLGGLLAGVASLVVAEPFTWLIVGRVLQGIGSAGTTVQAMALAGDLLALEKRAQVMSMLETSNAIGKATGPLIGAALATVAWFAPFFVFPATAIPVALVFWWYLGRMPDPHKERVSVAGHGRAFWRVVKPKVVPMGFAFLAAFVGVSIILLLLTLLSRELAEAGIEGVARGAFITAPEIVVAAAAFFTAKYLRTELEGRARRLTLIGMALFAISMVGSALLAGAAFNVSIWFFFAVVNLAGIGSGAVLATMNSLVANSVPAEERGVVTSLYGSVRSLSALSLPVFFRLSRIVDGETAVFWLLCALSLLLAIGTFFFLDTRRLLHIAS